MTQPVARPAIAAPQPAEAKARLTKAAEDFTAVALGEMLKPMFSTVNNANDMFGGKQGEEAWQPMMIDEIAKAIAHQGGLGLAAPVARAMIDIQEKKRS